MVIEQGHEPKEVARELGICIDTLRSWLKVSGMQLGQVSRYNWEQQRIQELEAEIRTLRKQLGEKDEVIDILKNLSASCWNHSGKIPLRPSDTSLGSYCGAGMPSLGDIAQRLLCLASSQTLYVRAKQSSAETEVGETAPKIFRSGVG